MALIIQTEFKSINGEPIVDRGYRAKYDSNDNIINVQMRDNNNEQTHEIDLSKLLKHRCSKNSLISSLRKLQRVKRCGSRRSASGSRRSASGSKRSASGSRRSASGSRRSASGSRRSASGSKRSASCPRKLQRSNRCGTRRTAGSKAGKLSSRRTKRRRCSRKPRDVVV